MQGGLVTQLAQACPHLRKGTFRLVAQAEERLAASQVLTCPRHFEDLVGSHGVRARFSGIAAESAIATVIPAKVGEREENLARIGNHSRLELFLYQARRL